MEKFTIILDNQNFEFVKSEHNYYIITPFCEEIEVEDLSNALIKQKGYYISCFGQYSPQKVTILEDDETNVIPFNVKEKCFFAQIKKSQGSKL